MTRSNSTAVYITAASVLNAAGTECAPRDSQPQAAQPLDFDPARLAHCVAAPALPAGVYDRKLSRSLEPQGARLLYCAGRLAETLRGLGLPDERIALTAAIPEVDGPSSCWDAVQAIGAQPADLLAQFFAHTPPLHALMMLNSSVMAHAAEALRCKGPMGGFCSQGNAGLDALMEAAAHLSEGRADAAVVVSSSPNITPALYLRDATHPPVNPGPWVFGEGAAALLLTTNPGSGARSALRIAGFARGYSAQTERGLAVGRDVIERALSNEKLCLSDVGQVVADAQDPQIAALFTLSGHTLEHSKALLGDLGASALLSEIAVTWALDCSRYTLLLEHSRGGHWGAVLLARTSSDTETMESYP